ncbi:MAG: histidine phosphatase family protein [Actinomycetota bacterium]
MEILLARHGETDWSASGRHTGHTDVPITDDGREQARALGRRLAGPSFELVLSSPLQRARETCELAGLGEHALLRDELMEWDYGAYEGLTTPQIREREPGWTVWTHPIIDGETVEQLGVRADRVISELAGTSGDCVVFAHGHVLRVLGARWLGLPAADGALLALNTATLSVLGYERERRVIRLWNESSHLERA